LCHRSLLERLLLSGNQLAYAALGERDETGQVGARKGSAFRGGLHFHEAAGSSHDDVHVGVAAGVLRIVEIEQKLTIDDADRDGGNEVFEWLAADES